MISSVEPSSDVYRFLNPECPRARDPVLQQTTVIRYDGDISSSTGFFHGVGKLVSTLGYTYQGQFSRGMMQGNGRIEWPDGTHFEGTFVDNVIEGKGKYSWPCGDWYNGDVSSGVRHGTGTFFYKAAGATYEGTWVVGKRDGKGVLNYSSDSSYSGEWAEDKRHGTGTMTYAGGSGTYEGEWRSDIREGFGTMMWRRGGIVVEKYEGEWVGGMPSGQGTSTYVGRATAGVRAASPTTMLQLSSSTTTTIHSAASFTKDGSGQAVTEGSVPLNTYVGEFVNGLRHGFGTFVYDDGSRYEGFWAHNHKHGDGKYTNHNGVIFVGTFVDGAPAPVGPNPAPSTFSTSRPSKENMPKEPRGEHTKESKNKEPKYASNEFSPTVSNLIPLYIRDLIGEGESNVQEAILAVQSVVSRNHGTFKKLFSYYRSFDTAVEVITTSPTWRHNRSSRGSINYLQFLRLANDARLLHCKVTVAVVDRLLLKFKDRNTTTTTRVYLTGEATEPNVLASFGGVKPTGGSMSKSRASSRKSEIYATPWMRYRDELHQYTGELNFREFVETLIRMAALECEDGIFGNLAHKTQVLIDEHLVPFAANPVHANPLYPLSREHKPILVPYVPLLQKFFLHYSRQSALGTVNPATSSGVGTDIVMTIRQFAVMLKELQILDGDLVTMQTLYKCAPFDAYPKLTATVLRNQHMKAPTQAVTTVAGATIHPHPTRSAAPTHSIPALSPTSATPAPGAGPTASASGTNFHHLVPPPIVTTTSDSRMAAPGVPSPTGRMSSRGSCYSTESANGPVFAEGMEKAYRSKVALALRSKGVDAKNLHQCMVMDLELTFVEFVELAVKIALIKITDGIPAQRLDPFFQSFFVANQGIVQHISLQ